MTVGEKIKKIRQKFGMTQEELADILSVSRQAITKWENDLGLPDTENLKEVSKTFGITIDYLLNSELDLPLLVMRKELNKEDYENNKMKSYEMVLKNYYSDSSEIYILTREKKMGKLESIFDFFVGSGTIQLADTLNDPSPYYLVKKDGIKLLVNIKDWILEVQELNSNIDETKLIVGKNKYYKHQKLVIK